MQKLSVNDPKIRYGKLICYTITYRATVQHMQSVQDTSITLSDYLTIIDVCT